jgi:hypothetical protein
MDKSGWVNIFYAYREKFGEGAPTFGYDDDEWPQMIIDAINSGVPMPPASDDVPEGTYPLILVGVNGSHNSSTLNDPNELAPSDHCRIVIDVTRVI